MIYNIREFGAVSDGVAMNTAAINRAIEACAENGGGRVVVPAGGVFMTGTIWMKSHVELHLEHGAVLKASGDFADYNSDDAYYQNFPVPDEEWTGAHLILAVECEDVAITGTGTIDGNASAFVTEKDVRPGISRHYVWFRGFIRAPRPGQTIAIVESKNVRVENITLRSLPSWGLFLHGCDHVQVRGVSVFNPPDVANTDGIDIDSCRYVTVSDCVIDTGDDAIAIRNDNLRLRDKTRVCEYVTITNCVLASSSSVFRIGVGRGVLRHMRVSNLTVHRGSVLINFCTEYGTVNRTPLFDINFSNISATDIARPLVMATRTGVPVQNITLENIRCEARASSYIWTEVPGSISDVLLRNVDIFMTDDNVELTEEVRKDRGEYVFDLRNAAFLEFDRVRVFGSEQELRKWSGVLRVQDCPFMVKKDCRL